VLAKRYAQALFDWSEEKKRTDAILTDVRSLRIILRDCPVLRSFLDNSGLSEAKRSAILRKLFQGRLGEETLTYLLFLSRKNRLSLLDGILTAFQEIHDDHRRRVSVEATVAKALKRDQLEAMLRWVEVKTGKIPRLHQTIDPAVIGGVCLKIGDQIYDGTIRCQLDRFARATIHHTLN